MKIDVSNIPASGLILNDEISPEELDLDTDSIKFKEPVKIHIGLSRITNTVDLEVMLSGLMHLICDRCLEETLVPWAKEFRSRHLLQGTQRYVDLIPEIREEIITEYPLKSLCKPDCLGLCLKCGANLNEGKCRCQ